MVSHFGKIVGWLLTKQNTAFLCNPATQTSSALGDEPMGIRTRPRRKLYVSGYCRQPMTAKTGKQTRCFSKREMSEKGTAQPIRGAARREGI